MSGVNEAFKIYFEQLKKLDKSDSTEHTLRPALHNLLKALADHYNSKINVIPEPRHDESGRGAPDVKFKIGESILGYLENKSVDINLDQVLKSEQIAKYKRLSGNLLITNYLEWIWLKDGQILKRETLAYASDIGYYKARLDFGKAEKTAELIQGFYSIPPEGIAKVKDLALALATRCHGLREFLEEELKRQGQEHQEGRLLGLFNVFKKDVFNELSLEHFSDVFAQMLGYGLFLARLNSGKEAVTLDNAKKYIPANFELIRELVNFLDELEKLEYRRIRWLVEEILSIMNTLDLSEILEGLAFSKRQKRLLEQTEEERLIFAKDPYIYFYEDFLKAYDASMRKSRGVYYTPPPVNFIVRAINDILINSFGIKEGLADRKQVTVLDFATGTGTFLLEVVQQILDGTAEGVRDLVIRDHVLKNLYGFEYLIAPYTIAHLKLSQFLHEKGYQMQPQERLQIYLTNTLEPISPQPNYLLPALSKEVEQAQEIKEKPILVITGNPPYNVKSKNVGIINNLVKDAYAPADEKKMNWDDYVKFIRFAHHKMETIDRGIIGIITNNSYLNAVTLRQMRNRLMKDFNAIYILNLHGNSLIGEMAPDGGLDMNVFDIRVGVSIVLLVKTEASPKSCKISYDSIQTSKRIDKYKYLLDGDMRLFQPLDVASFNKQFATTRWAKRFAEPLSFFVPSSDGYAKQMKAYGDFWGLADIFGERVNGTESQKDPLAIQFHQDDFQHILDFYRSNKKNDLIEELGLNKLKENNEKEFNEKKQKMESYFAAIKELNTEHNYVNIFYRPFDFRITHYSSSSTFHARPRYEVMSSMLKVDNNLALLSARLTDCEHATHFICTNYISEKKAAESTKGSYHFPLYFLRDMFGVKEKQENLKYDFRRWLDKKYNKKFMPEQVLGYIYAVLHCPTYRAKYDEFLKVDFPRIPFVDDVKQFEKVSKLGWKLVQAHLLKEIPATPKVDITKGSDLVVKPVYGASNQRLYINTTQYFAPVPEDVWNFQIGGYQVLDKYLKSRKGRKLTLDEIENIFNVVKVLRFTIDQMKKIDEVFKL